MSRKALALSLQFFVKQLKSRKELISDFQKSGHMNRRGNHVIARLSQVHVIVGVYRRFPSPFSGQEFVGPARNHLVDIHIGGRPRAGLEHIHNELIIELAFQNFLGRGHDALAEAGVEKPEFRIHLRRMFLDQSNGPNEGGGKLQGADGEVLPGALGLCPIVGFLRHQDFPHGI